LLDRIIDDKWLSAHAVVGFWPANTEGDDIVLYTDNGREEELARFPMLRQQARKREGRPNHSLADYIAPKETGIEDWFGGFAVTTGADIEKQLKVFDDNLDDYNSILLKALADRLAEAFAERMHELTRREHWGYAADEKLSNEDIIRERYDGIRPAPGYPACPDHSEKPLLFELLDATTHTTVRLSESFAMLPAASVSGFYFSHPRSQYFGVGKVSEDQVKHCAERRGLSSEKDVDWLGPSLVY